MSMTDPDCLLHVNEDGSICGTMHDEIARSAYSMYLRRGAQGGEHVRDWLVAEAQVRARHASTVYVRPISRAQPIAVVVT